MLTVTCQPNESETPNVAQNEITVSDREISRRVLQIRAGWTIGERVRRRREAERRFEELLDTLLADAA